MGLTDLLKSLIYIEKTTPCEAVRPLPLDHYPRPLAIFVNAQEIATTASTLKQLIDDQGHAGARVATAVNGEFVPARAWSETLLRDGDRVEIVTARQGG